MKNEIAKQEQRITDMETRLEAQIKENMGQTNTTCPTPTVLPVSKHKHPLFPQVDLTQFADAVPDPVHNVSTKPASVASPEQDQAPYIIPYNMRVRAIYKGRLIMCWMEWEYFTKHCHNQHR